MTPHSVPLHQTAVRRFWGSNPRPSPHKSIFRIFQRFITNGSRPLHIEVLLLPRIPQNQTSPPPSPSPRPPSPRCVPREPSSVAHVPSRQRRRKPPQNHSKENPPPFTSHPPRPSALFRASSPESPPSTPRPRPRSSSPTPPPASTTSSGWRTRSRKPFRD